LPRNVQEYISALQDVDGGPNGTRRDALRRLISAQCELGNWDSALLNCFELRTAAERARDIRNVAFALSHQGRVEVAQNRWDEALESYLSAIERFMETGDREGVCTANRAMGIIYGNKGDHASAIRCLESSFTMAKAIGNRELEARTEANLAIVYDLEGREAESERASQHCLTYFLESGDLHTASRIANNLGVLYMSRERYDEAAEYFEKTIGSCRTIQNREVLGASLVNAGYCYARMGDTDRSITYTDEAITVFKEPHNMNMLALAYRNYGYLEFRNSNLNKAFEWFEKSVRSARASGVEDTFAACCVEYGMALIKSATDLKLARKLLKKSSSIYREIGNASRARAIEHELAAV
jgi:tetratricopeptide (TPR) repeat protein